MGDFEGQVAVVTGASAGIGAALARELAARGARLVLAARRREALEAVAASLPPSATPLVVVADVTRRADVERLRDEALARFGQVDLWVNNAGRGITRPPLELTDEDLDAMLRDNLRSVLYGLQAIVPHMKERGRGTVANVSSMLGRVPLAPFRSAYGAMKAAVNNLTEALRFELARTHPGIQVCLVLPGVVATDFGNNALGGGPDSRALPGAQPVEEAARVIADGLRDGRPDIYTRTEQLAAAVAHLQALGKAP